jgi:hypothetical protein
VVLQNVTIFEVALGATVFAVEGEVEDITQI